VIFSEGLAEHRDLLEPGTAVLLFLSAEVQGDEVRARIQSAEPLDNAAANLQKGLRVFLRDGAPLDAVAKRLEPAGPGRSAQGNTRAPANGDGEVSVVLLLNRGTEVEVKLPGRFKVSPQIAGAIKAVPGVVQVEAL
jgi:DNA polymerase-3 subunit alpha